jgi:hypothetical protein
VYAATTRAELAELTSDLPGLAVEARGQSLKQARRTAKAMEKDSAS